MVHGKKTFLHHGKTIRDKVQRPYTVVDLIKLKLFGHICRMNDNRLINTVTLGWLKP